MPLSPSKFHGQKIQELRKRLLAQTRAQVGKGLSGPDLHIIRAAQVGKSLETVFNLLYEQTLEWYGLHFPELKNVVKDPGSQLEMMVRIGDRANYSEENVEKFFTDEASISRILQAAKTSSGGAIDAKSLSTLQDSARACLAVREENTRLNTFVKKEMLELAPNFAQLATPIIAAQLLTKAGSLQRLSEMPGSTLQVLGAEEALFSHLRHRTRSPKHGFIFNHPFLKTLPKHARGKMARALAGKLAICVRVDMFGSAKVWEEYHQKLSTLSQTLAKSKPKPRTPNSSPAHTQNIPFRPRPSFNRGPRKSFGGDKGFKPKSNSFGNSNFKPRPNRFSRPKPRDRR